MSVNANPLKMFIPITKVDAVQRLVYGLATAEQPDKSNEVCDYASTRPLYEKWSGDFHKATEGKSLGNVRVMHGQTAVGKLTSINFNDTDKQIEICAKVVDDNEWNKVVEGVYTGFSQGGRYVKRWKDETDDKLMRYTADPAEVSLVDSPCLPTATFQMVKEDGATELRKFTSVLPDTVDAAAVEAAAAADKLAKDAAVAAADPARARLRQVWVSDDLPGQTFDKKDDGTKAVVKFDAESAVKTTLEPITKAVAELTTALDVKDGGKKTEPDKTETVEKVEPEEFWKKDFTDDQRKKMAAEGSAMKDGSYPIANKVDLKNAIQAFGRAKNKIAVKRHIIKRAKALGATAMLPDGWISKLDAGKEGLGEVKKGASLYGVANLVQLLASIANAEDDLEYPTMYGTSVDKALTDRFGACVVELGDIAAAMLDACLSDMKDEEASESMMANAMQLADLMKAGARHSKGDQKMVQAIHDQASALGADCGDEAGKSHNHDDLAKAQFDRVTAENAALIKAIEGVPAVLGELMTRVKNIELQPAVIPPHSGLTVVGKNGRAVAVDGGNAGASGLLTKSIEEFTLEDRDELAKIAIRISQQNPLTFPGR